MRQLIDRTHGKSGLVVLGLVVLAMVQVGAIVLSASRAHNLSVVHPPDLVIGDAILEVRGRDTAGTTSLSLKRPDGKWTVLLAFSPTCAWCDSVAPRWKSWTQGIDRPVHVFAVASGDPSAALRYTRTHGWKIEDLIVVDSAEPGVLGRQLTRKTPWLFLFDSSGILRYSGHGNEIETVDSLTGSST